MAARSNVLNMLVSFTGCLIWCFHLLSSLSAKLSEPFSRFIFDGRTREVCRSPKMSNYCFEIKRKSNHLAVRVHLFRVLWLVSNLPVAQCREITGDFSWFCNIFSFFGEDEAVCHVQSQRRVKKKQRGLIKHNRKCCFQPLWLGSIYQKVFSPKKYINFE